MGDKNNQEKILVEIVDDVFLSGSSIQNNKSYQCDGSTVVFTTNNKEMKSFYYDVTDNVYQVNEMAPLSLINSNKGKMVKTELISSSGGDDVDTYEKEKKLLRKPLI